MNLQTSDGNGDLWIVATVILADSRPEVCWLGLRVSGHPVLCLHSANIFCSRILCLSSHHVNYCLQICHRIKNRVHVILWVFKRIADLADISCCVFCAILCIIVAAWNRVFEYILFRDLVVCFLSFHIIQAPCHFCYFDSFLA